MTPQFGIGMGSPSKGVLRIIIGCVAVFVLQQILDARHDGAFSNFLALSWQGVAQGRIWQFASYIFLHATPSHLLINMFLLYMIGPETERGLGYKHFFQLFILSGIVGGICWLLPNIGGQPSSLVGASGGIFGILCAFAALYPNRRMMLLFFPFVTFRAWVLVVCLALLEFILLVSRTGSVVAYAAHLGGGITGCCYALIGFRKGMVSWLWNRTKDRYIQRKNQAIAPAVVDAILDKVAREGIHSLNGKEKTILERASRNRNG